jgi:Tol biopolymer transport system component
VNTTRQRIIISLIFVIVVLATNYSFASNKTVSIAFVRNADIWTINSDGTNQLNITKSKEEIESFPSWSPDRKQIAFSKTSDLWLMDANGENVRRLTSYFAAYYADSDIAYSSWSPDGQKIAFCLQGIDGFLNLAIITLKTKKVQLIENASFNAEYIVPSWSPDGKSIAISAISDHGYVTIYNLKTKKFTNLPKLLNNRVYGAVTWAPDSKKLVCAIKTSDKSSITSFSLDDLKQTELLKDITGDIWTVKFSKNGRALVYDVTSRPYNSKTHTSHIWTYDLQSKLSKKIILNALEPDW